MKQLLAYCYRVVFFETGHFTRLEPEQVLPVDIIQENDLQARAASRIKKALFMINANDHDHVDAAKAAHAELKSAIRQFYISLICHDIGSTPFQLPILSFCAMLSRKVHGKCQGLWHDAGNFNSHLSALTWCAQLIIFDFACFQEAYPLCEAPFSMGKETLAGLARPCSAAAPAIPLGRVPMRKGTRATARNPSSTCRETLII